MIVRKIGYISIDSTFDEWLADEISGMLDGADGYNYVYGNDWFQTDCVSVLFEEALSYMESCDDDREGIKQWLVDSRSWEVDDESDWLEYDFDKCWHDGKVWRSFRDLCIIIAFYELNLEDKMCEILEIENEFDWFDIRFDLSLLPDSLIIERDREKKLNELLK